MLLINPYRFAAPRSSDADVNAYILAVEAADGQELEAGVITAVETFVVGCKADGIWSAIKASCILAGARTLSGALVPLVGSAPTNYNFVSGDYNRETGLLGNGSTKYLNSNRGSMSDPQDNQHMSVYMSQTATFNAFRQIIAATAPPQTYLLSGTSQQLGSRHRTTSTFQNVGQAAIPGFKGATRNNSDSYYTRSGGSNFTRTQASSSGSGSAILVFGGPNQFDGRLSFYSIGESLDLADLDTRVSTLMTDLAAAI